MNDVTTAGQLGCTPAAAGRVRHIVDGTVQRRILWGVALGNTLATVLRSTVGFARPCERSGLRCDDGRIAVLATFLVASVLYGVFFLFVSFRFWYTSVRRHLLLNKPDHWTAAASRDVFLECSAALNAQHDMSLVLLTSVTSLIAIARAIQVAGDPAASLALERAEVEEYLDATCGASDGSLNACRLAWISRFPLATLIVGTLLYLVCVYLSTPVIAWSSTMQEAAKKTGHRRVRRLRIVPWAILVFALSSLGLFGWLLTLNNMSAREMVAHMIACFVQLGLHTGVILWVNEVDNLRATVQHAGDGLRTVAATLVAWITFACCWPASVCWGSPHRISAFIDDDVLWTGSGTMHLSRETGVRQQQLVLLQLNVLLWGLTSSTPAWWFNAMMWCYRVFCLLLLLFTRDEPAGFGDLEGAPAFGLVVDKWDLCKAIDCKLKGLNFVGTVRRYKGSVLRMHETVAVSYRWQPHEVQLSSQCSVNMSKWQLQELQQYLLHNCNALYVWIDHLSVPQDMVYSRTKRLLLSRMMAVYASASSTLVLRSVEVHYSRYHQRGWTLQEFCAARELVIRTQGSCQSDGSARGMLYSVLADEEKLFMEMREQHLRNRVEKKPIWIYGPGIDVYSDEEVAALDDQYAKLSSSLQTQDQADIIRALYPILWGRPVESQEELMTLVRQVSERTERFSASDMEPRALSDLRMLQALAAPINVAKKSLNSLADTWKGMARPSLSLSPSFSRQRSRRRSGRSYFFWSGPEPFHLSDPAAQDLEMGGQGTDQQRLLPDPGAVLVHPMSEASHPHDSGAVVDVPGLEL